MAHVDTIPSRPALKAEEKFHVPNSRLELNGYIDKFIDKGVWAQTKRHFLYAQCQSARMVTLPYVHGVSPT